MIQQFIRRLFRRPSGRDLLRMQLGKGNHPWLTMPRVFIDAMPDEWQRDLARLLEEWGHTWRYPDFRTSVNIRRLDGSFAAMPAWLTNYHTPNSALIASMKEGSLIRYGIWEDWCRRYFLPRWCFPIDKPSYARQTRPLTNEDLENNAQQVFVALDEEERKQL